MIKVNKIKLFNLESLIILKQHRLVMFVNEHWTTYTTVCSDQCVYFFSSYSILINSADCH